MNDNKPYYEGGDGYTQEDLNRLQQYFGPTFDEGQMKDFVARINELDNKKFSSSSKYIPAKNRKVKNKISKNTRKRNRK